MSNKWVNPQPKLVPQPYTNLLTERDIGKPPILETRHLGIDFGGLTAVADFNLAIGRTEITGLIGPNGAVDLQIIVNKLYADVSQGNVRYNIATKADIAIIATAANGTKMTKNYRASYSVEGAFQASNKNIADAVNSVLTDTIADMAQDTSIHDFIKQNAR